MGAQALLLPAGVSVAVGDGSLGLKQLPPSLQSEGLGQASESRLRLRCDRPLCVIHPSLGGGREFSSVCRKLGCVT